MPPKTAWVVLRARSRPRRNPYPGQPERERPPIRNYRPTLYLGWDPAQSLRGVRTTTDLGEELYEQLEDQTGDHVTRTAEGGARIWRPKIDLSNSLALAVRGLVAVSDEGDDLVEQLRSASKQSWRELGGVNALTKGQIEEAIAETGSLIAAAERLGVPRSTLRVRAQKVGVDLPPVGGRRILTKADIENALATAGSLSGAARLLRVSRNGLRYQAGILGASLER